MQQLVTVAFLTGLAMSSLLPSMAMSGVFISELCDPRLNYTTDRFIEIHNSGPGPVSLTGWSVIAVGNGTEIFTWDLSGDIEVGEALVLGDATTVDSFPVDFPDEAWSNSNGLWNGKVGDGARLVDPSSVVIDNVVVDATRFENRDYVRNPGVTAGNTSFDPGEWTGTSVDYPTQGSPGTHSADPPVPTPVISGVVIDPEAPLPGQTVHVQATVVDAAAIITTVVLWWGTSATVLPNQIIMSNIGGEVYQTAVPIPGQDEGVTVYYRIEATNDVPVTSTTSVANYTLPVVVTIQDIQAQVEVSPFDGLPVITHGVVTGVFVDFITLQNGNGAWSGLWVGSAAALSRGDSVVIRGTVTESYGQGFDGTTFLADPEVLVAAAGAGLPGAVPLSTADISNEGYEGVLIATQGAMCTNPDLDGLWVADDGSGPAAIGRLGYDPSPILGTIYDVAGVLIDAAGTIRLEPRDSGDVSWVGDPTPPTVANATATDSTTVVVAFSEDVETFSAETPGNYTIAGLAVTGAMHDSVNLDQVVLTVSPMPEGTHTLIVDGVEDLHGNAASGASGVFEYIDNGAPAGYYDTAAGLTGDALRGVLHEIIDEHTAYSYDYAWTAFYSTDDKPNGHVWDIYSDIPGGTPPYEYTFGVDEGGIGGAEGRGYTREHSWPKSWFGGAVSPMYSDLFALYPCDAHVNGNRGVDPYGEVTNPVWVSLNGGKRGPCTYPGYTGSVFEPIDAYKGDLARTYFYMATRYYTEDAAWPGSPMTDGADLLPWAVPMLLEWHQQDPVSQKEFDRNGAIFGLQMNRNPFIDHPEFAQRVFGDISGVGEVVTAFYSLGQATPNPFNPATKITYFIPANEFVSLVIYSVDGRVVKTLVSEQQSLGRYEVVWNGEDNNGRRVASGTYLYGLKAGQFTELKKMTLVK